MEERKEEERKEEERKDEEEDSHNNGAGDKDWDILHQGEVHRGTEDPHCSIESPQPEEGEEDRTQDIQEEEVEEVEEEVEEEVV